MPTPPRTPRPRPARLWGASTRDGLRQVLGRGGPGGRRAPGGGARSRVLRRILAGLGVVLLVTLLWVGVRLLLVRGHLEQARRDVAAAREEVRAGHVELALERARAAGAATAATRGLHRDPVWWLGRHLPLIGSTLVTTEGLADAADDLATSVLPPLAEAADDVRGERIRLPDGGFDLTRVRSAGARLAEAQRVLQATMARVQALPAVVLLGPVGTARDQLLAELRPLEQELNRAGVATRLAPAMLGADGPRRYFLALQNTAEARGSGGIIGAYGVVVADRGRLSLVKAGGDRDLVDQDTSATPFPADLERRWGSFGVTSIWRNANLSPHWPWASQVLQALYSKAYGERLDGVIGLDPAAAGYVLDATGPVRLADGTELTGANLTTFVQQTLYARYPDSGARQAVLTEIQKAIFGALLRGGDPGGLLSALGRASGEGRLLVASADPAEQALLEGTSLGGAVPEEAGPYGALVLTNSSGDKLDFYLDRDVAWDAEACGGPRRTVTLTASLTSNAPSSGLPPYVAGGETINRVVPVGSLQEYVSVYGTPGGRLLSATVDGQEAVVVQDTERGHPVASLYLTLAPGARHTLRVAWDEPSGGPVHPLRVSPLVRPPTLRSAVPACSG